MSGASVHVICTAQYYNSACTNCDWVEVRAVQSQALSHAMDADHDVEIQYVTVSRAEAVSKEQAHGAHKG